MHMVVPGFDNGMLHGAMAATKASGNEITWPMCVSSHPISYYGCITLYTHVSHHYHHHGNKQIASSINHYY